MAQTPEGAIKCAAARIGMTLGEYLEKINAGLKRCTKCKTWKPTGGFARDVTRYDGLKASCLECGRVEVRAVTKGRPSPFKGRTHSDEAKAKMSAARMGNGNKKGKGLTADQRKTITRRTREQMPKGAGCWWAWKGGITPANMAARGSSEYNDWRKAVFERDGYTCQRCGDNKGGNLNAHHFKPFATHPELRYDVDNGITLCEDCHEAEHRGKPRIRA